MRGLQNFFVVSSLALAGATHAQNAVQWRVEDGGNGHWYQLVLPSVRVSSSAASLTARAQGGDLASIVSAAENNFVFALAVSDPTHWSLVWPGGTQITGPWIGAGYSGSDWSWLDGAPWSFTNWAPSEPNYLFEETVVLFMGPANGPPTNMWNNIQPTYVNWGSIVEYSADCNNDGIVDYGQIRVGELVDLNANNIPDCCEPGASCDPCPGDVDESGAVNAVDLAAILNTWGSDGGKYPGADIDGNGTVDASDLTVVLSSWGACP